MELLWVELGNKDAIEAYRDPTSDDPELVRFRPDPGEKVTRLEWLIPEGEDRPSTRDRLRDIQGAIPLHLPPGSLPQWVESEDDDFTKRAAIEFDIQDNTRPPTWGQEAH